MFRLFQYIALVLVVFAPGVSAAEPLSTGAIIAIAASVSVLLVILVALVQINISAPVRERVAVLSQQERENIEHASARSMSSSVESK